MNKSLEWYCGMLPKLELHAHLNGSLSNKTLIELHQNDCNSSSDITWIHTKAVIDHGDKRNLDECFELFDVAYSLTRTPDAIQKATRDVIKEFADEGAIYLELRSTPREVLGIMSKVEYIQAIVETIQEFSATNKIIVKLLVSINRSQGKEMANDTLKVALQARLLYPNIILGMDLSGNPNTGDIDDYLPILEQAKEQGLKISIHIAEIPNTKEIKKILEFKPHRLGHATCIHPLYGGTEEIWQQLLESKIPIEVCLTSNVKTKTVNSYGNHHFKHLFSMKHPIALATDDKGVFATSLSQEYQHAALSFSLTREQIWDLSISSIDHIFGSDNEKKQLMNIFMKCKPELLH